MSYSDNGSSFMFVLNSEWQPAWQIHNARGHVAIGLAAQSHKEANLLTYETPALHANAHISMWPVIDKSATQLQLNKLYEEALKLSKEKQITLNFFTDSMFGASAADQMSQTKEAQSPTILAMGMFGDSKILKTLTKRLKLASF